MLSSRYLSGVALSLPRQTAVQDVAMPLPPAIHLFPDDDIFALVGDAVPVPFERVLADFIGSIPVLLQFHRFQFRRLQPQSIQRALPEHLDGRLARDPLAVGGEDRAMLRIGSRAAPRLKRQHW